MTDTGASVLMEMSIEEARKKSAAFVAQKDQRIAALEDALRQIADMQIAQAEPAARHMKTVARLALQGR